MSLQLLDKGGEDGIGSNCTSFLSAIVVGMSFILHVPLGKYHSTNKFLQFKERTNTNYIQLKKHLRNLKYTYMCVCDHTSWKWQRLFGWGKGFYELDNLLESSFKSHVKFSSTWNEHFQVRASNFAEYENVHGTQLWKLAN